MKNKTIVKNKRILSPDEKKNLLLTVLFSVLSLGVGFLVAFFGKGKSYIETELITAIITLFGFGLTATVFIYQAFEHTQSDDTMRVIKALSKTLLLTLCLIVTALVLDFIVITTTSEIWCLILKGLKYATLVYSGICQFDILNSFIVIITKRKKDDSNKNE